MPLNMFGIQYSGLSRLHRCDEILDAAIPEHTKGTAFLKYAPVVLVAKLLICNQLSSVRIGSGAPIFE